MWPRTVKYRHNASGQKSQPFGPRGRNSDRQSTLLFYTSSNLCLWECPVASNSLNTHLIVTNWPWPNVEIDLLQRLAGDLRECPTPPYPLEVPGWPHPFPGRGWGQAPVVTGVRPGATTVCSPRFVHRPRAPPFWRINNSANHIKPELVKGCCHNFLHEILIKS